MRFKRSDYFPAVIVSTNRWNARHARLSSFCFQDNAKKRWEQRMYSGADAYVVLIGKEHRSDAGRIELPGQPGWRLAGWRME
jgi:hypothetical protein